MNESQCFVIQPFDGAAFDRRYVDVISPAIREAGMEPYRVDRDPSAHVPIAKIEDEIRRSGACVADISTDNPNVWYEVGFAFAVGHPVVLICAQEQRERGFPFDIQHRLITPYSTQSVSDFSKLRQQIVDRLKAVQAAGPRAVPTKSAVEGSDENSGEQLSPSEVIALAAIMEDCLSPWHSVRTSEVQGELSSHGFNKLGISVILGGLRSKKMIEDRQWRDEGGREYIGLAVTERGVQWLQENQDLLDLRRPDPFDGSHIPF